MRINHLNFFVSFLFGIASFVGSDPINVHVVCHTHDDVGWLKTIDEYFMGANNSIQNAGVQYILDSVIDSLVANPNRKFIYVEIAFFTRWWNEQTDDMKRIVSNLVANGQLEFINGGWCMNDEATAYYVDIIDQMTLGHEFLLNTFNVKPRIGWHIDPFGHSSVQAQLFAMMGFDGFFFGRIDFQDKINRLTKKDMEFIWRSSPSLGVNAQLLAGVTYNGYGPPDGFCFDFSCGDPPIQNDKNLFDYNIDERANLFIAAAREYAKHFNTNNVMMTMGSDFQYSNANAWYKNLDKLMNYLQKYNSSIVNVFYSTPSIYLDALKASGVTWSVKTDDFFPYADWFHAYWTGYFVSRPAIKGYVREQSSYLQTCRQFEVLTPNLPSSYSSYTLNEAMAVAQHHDAVSGTEKQHVANDYAKRIAIGQNKCMDLTNYGLATLVTSSGNFPTFTQCPLLNVSLCPPSQNYDSKTVLVVVAYNNLAHERVEYVRIPFPFTKATVSDNNGVSIPSQVIPKADGNTNILVFPVDVNSVGYNTYFITGSAQDSIEKKEIDVGTDMEEIDDELIAYVSDLEEVDDDEGNASIKHPQYERVEEVTDTTLSNGIIQIVFDGTTNRIAAFVGPNGIKMNVDQSIMYYRSSIGDKDDGQASGAYIFRPNVSDTFPLNNSNTPKLIITNGTCVQEATLVFGDWATERIRLYNGASYAEIEYEIGPIDISDGWGKEVITKWKTDIESQKYFYTDANGREMQQRQIDYRPTWPLQVYEPVAGNYYPINTAAYIQDSSRRFTIVTDRSQGGGSIADGELEVMLHRRTLRDDSRGVGEPINEQVNNVGLVIRTKHYVFLDTFENSAASQRTLEERLSNKLTLFFATTSSVSDWKKSHFVNQSLINQLPPNVHLVTLQELPNNRFLVRLAHMYEVKEHSVYSQPVTVDLEDIFFRVLKVTKAMEVSLSGNQPVENIRNKHKDWKTNPAQTDNFDVEPEHHHYDLSAFVITMSPMQIRSFILQ